MLVSRPVVSRGVIADAIIIAAHGDEDIANGRAPVPSRLWFL